MAVQDELGTDLPALLNKPKLSDRVAEVNSAYVILSLTRSGNGMGPNPISLAEIKAYIDLHGQPWLPVDVFVELLTRMDRVFLNLLAEEQRVKLEKQSSSGGRKAWKRD